MTIKIHPRYTKEFIGHNKEKKLFEDSYFNNTLQHCWLLEGSQGIGKATFAYCAARSILSLNEVHSDGLSLFNDLEDHKKKNNLDFNYDDNNSIHNRISENTHSDLKIIEPLYDQKASQTKEIIPVDNVRQIESFFSKTSGEGGWRIAIIDSLDNLNKHGSNALLKILEEPPKKCLIFLISSNKSNVLDTIRSRSRILKFSELSHQNTKLIIQTKTIVQNEVELQKVNLLAEGSPGKAIMLYNNNGLNIYDALIDLFNKNAEIDTKKIDQLLRDITDKKNIFGLKIISILVTIYLNRAFRRSLQLIKLDISKIEKESQENFLQYFNIADIPSLWENISTNINLSLRYNLDKKQTLITIIEKMKNLKKNNEVFKGN